MSTAGHNCPWLRGNQAFVDFLSIDDAVACKKHAAHVLLWCETGWTDSEIDDNVQCSMPAKVMMQLRFDGRLGFPGGYIEEMDEFDRSKHSANYAIQLLKKGVKREVQEEMGETLELVELGSTAFDDDIKYLYSSRPTEQADLLALHLFTWKISDKLWQALLSNVLHYSTEVLGVTIVPLYTMSDGKRGFPRFLTNSFAGNANEQLLKGLQHLNLLSHHQVTTALQIAMEMRLGDAQQVIDNV